MANKTNGNSFNLNIQPFDGNHQLMDLFFSQYRYLVASKKFTDAEAILFLPNFLTGNAHSYYLLNQEIKKADSFDTVVSIFKEYFSPISQSISLADFETLKFFEGETIKNFALRLDNICSKVFPEISAEALDSIKLKKFQALLPSNIRLKLMEHDSKSYKENVAMATKYNQILQENQSFLNSTLNEINFINVANNANPLNSDSQMQNAQSNNPPTCNVLVPSQNRTVLQNHNTTVLPENFMLIDLGSPNRKTVVPQTVLPSTVVPQPAVPNTVFPMANPILPNSPLSQRTVLQNNVNNHMLPQTLEWQSNLPTLNNAVVPVHSNVANFNNQHLQTQQNPSTSLLNNEVVPVFSNIANLNNQNLQTQQNPSTTLVNNASLPSLQSIANFDRQVELTKHQQVEPSSSGNILFMQLSERLDKLEQNSSNVENQNFNEHSPKRNKSDFHGKIRNRGNRYERQSVPYSTPPRNRRLVFCQICDKAGHIAKYCFKYKQQNKTRQNFQSRKQQNNQDHPNGF